MNIIGISAFYHDSAVALIRNGEICFAAQEERYTRIKHDASFPSFALKDCLQRFHLCAHEIDALVFYEKPFIKLERLLETYLNHAPHGFASFQKAFPLWSKEKVFQRQRIHKYLYKIDPSFESSKVKLLFCEHHLSHGASCFYPSPFREALVLTMDGVGEWATTSVQRGVGNQLLKEKEIHFPHSLGLFYSAFTDYLGFKVNSGEYKLMGLAPYGKPVYKQKILDHFFKIFDDGSFHLNQKYFDYATGLKMIRPSFSKLFGLPMRMGGEPITSDHMDIAASAQAALESVVLHMTEKLHQTYGGEQLCLAGGVALNCVLNSKIQKQGLYKKIWVQPAAGDAGGALGAALYYWHQTLDKQRVFIQEDSMKGVFLGPSFSPQEIQRELEENGAVYTQHSEDELVQIVARSLSEGSCVGWFQGAMEYGPRALGNRSILADARDPQMQKNLNLKIKYREGFRPFAPAVLEEKAKDWFSLTSSPYMLFIADVLIKAGQGPLVKSDAQGFDQLKEMRSPLPAVTHVDHSARLQTVSQQTNPLFHKLLSQFDQITGVPVLVNTSFNVRGEPIVCRPADAYRCFMGTELDLLVVGPFLLKKSEQKKSVDPKFKESFERD